MKETSQLKFRNIITILRCYKKRILILAAVACVLALGVEVLKKDRFVVASVVSFSYDGVESGRDPAGNRFDEREIKCDDVIARAAEAAGMEVQPADIALIQSAIEIRGSVSDTAFESITEHLTIFEDDQVENTENIREAAYYPSKYKVVLHYRDAQFSQSQGILFLQELLSAYEQYFYERYGYNHSLEESISAIDYNEYDYIDAVEILDARLDALRAYLSMLAVKDNTRFVSSRTGRGFSDLVDAIDTIRSEDINRLYSRIITNNISKDREDLINYYTYRIEDAQREVTQIQTRIDTLTSQIQEYEKTRTVLWGMSEYDSEEQAGVNYEFSQHSQMYDQLFNDKVESETDLAAAMERIALFQSRIDRLLSTDTPGESSIAISELQRVSENVAQLLVATSETADDFFRTVQLKRAFQIMQEPKLSFNGLLHDTVLAWGIIFIAIFGLTALWIPVAFRAERKRIVVESLQKESEMSSSVEAGKEGPMQRGEV